MRSTCDPREARREASNIFEGALAEPMMSATRAGAPALNSIIEFRSSRNSK